MILLNPLRSSPPILTIDSSAYTANQVSEYIIGGQILSPGGSTINVNGIPYSLVPSAARPPNIASIFSALSSHSEPILTINGKVYTADSASRYIIGSQTLIPGGPTITVDNIPYALPALPTAILSGGRTVALDLKNTADPSVFFMPTVTGFGSTKPTQIYTVDGIYLTGDPDALTVGSRTLKPGAPALTVSGHTLSLASEGALVVDGTTSTLTFETSNVLKIGGAPGPTTEASQLGSNNPSQVYTVDGIYLTGVPNALAVGGTTLSPGSPPLTVSGYTLSLATGGALVIDGSASILASNALSTSSSKDVAVASTTGASAFGNESNAEIFTGDADREKLSKMVLSMSILISLMNRIFF